MFSLRLPALLLILGLGFALIGCDQIPEEGTIVYDIDFPRADSDEAQGGGGGGGGSSNGSTPSGLSTSASVSVTTINEGATDTESSSSLVHPTALSPSLSLPETLPRLRSHRPR